MSSPGDHHTDHVTAVRFTIVTESGFTIKKRVPIPKGKNALERILRILPECEELLTKSALFELNSSIASKDLNKKK